MLVYLSDLLSEFHSEPYLKEFSKNAFNDVFHLIRSNLGTYERVATDEQYDLILTNPPYVTSGSASLKNAIDVAGVAKQYADGGRGTESLAIQWIVNHLKPAGESYVIVPDGLLNQVQMLDYIKERCCVIAVISLPSRTFYSTPKKTYILAVRRKETAKQQTDPVFTYLVSEIGESRDSRRVPIDDNDMTTMEREYGYFRAAPAKYKSTDPRCKIVPWADFSALSNWLVDRNWTMAEKIDLGIAEKSAEVDGETFRGLVHEAKQALDRLYKELS